MINRSNRPTVRACVLLLASLAGFSGPAGAQTALTGGVNGRISDTSGARVPGAMVTLSSVLLSVDRETITGPDGTFAVLGLVPGDDYRLTVAMPGFREWQRDNLTVASNGTASVEVTLSLQPLAETVTVSETTSSIVSKPELGQVLSAATVQNTPVAGRQVTRLALLDPHVRNAQGFGGDGSAATRLSINGASFRDTHYRLDGDVNNDAFQQNAPMQLISLGAVQEFKVLSNQYSAEFGGTSAGLLIMTTKSGSNLWRGETFLQGRPDSFNARPPLATTDVPNNLVQSGGSIGGPLVAGRTFLFASYEGSRQNRGSPITSPAASVFSGAFREQIGLVRLDQRLSPTNTLAVRLNGHRTTNTNPNDRVGGLNQASYGQRTNVQSLGVQVSDRATVGRLLNEARFNIVDALPTDSRPLEAGIGTIRPGYSTEGFSTYAKIDIRLYQASNQLSFQFGRHALRTGGEVVHQRYADFSETLFGDYRFAAGAPTAGQQPLQYTQRFGVADLRYRDTRAAAFVQDDWNISPRLTMNLGMRWEYQESVGDGNNVAPRFGLVYDASGNGKTVLRGGLGVFYDQAFQHGLRQRFLQNGPNVATETITLAAGDPGFPVYPASLTAIPSGLTPALRSLYVRGDRMVNPYSSQLSFGVQQQLGAVWTGSVDLVHSRTYDQFLATNLNAPSPFPRTAAGQVRSVAAADATRPFSTYQGVPVRDVQVSGNGGRAYYDSVAVGLARRFSGRYELSSRYLYSRVEDSITDDHHGANPNEWSDIVAAERAVGEFSQPHRFVTFGSAAVPGDVQLSGVFTLSSGVPVNALTGVDNNGDTTNTDRPAGFARNAFRGPRHSRVDLAAAKRLTLAATRLELRAEIFNLFNHANYFRLNNVYGNGASPAATFLQPIGGVGNVDPGRQLQLVVKVQF